MNTDSPHHEVFQMWFTYQLIFLLGGIASLTANRFPIQGCLPHKLVAKLNLRYLYIIYIFSH